jgi:cation diffusion facilitator CzcD-associated flavoprotein CzcO
MPTSATNVIIIGAGTGGLCLAQGLRRAGIGVAVYERDRTRRDGLQGYRVGTRAAGMGRPRRRPHRGRRPHDSSRGGS